MIRSLKIARTLAAAAAVVVLVGACSGTSSGSAAPSGSAGGAGKQYVVGVSNTLQGNGWREEMICSIKAQALASGQVSKVVVANRNTDTAGQIEDLRSLISSGVN